MTPYSLHNFCNIQFPNFEVAQPLCSKHDADLIQRVQLLAKSVGLLLCMMPIEPREERFTIKVGGEKKGKVVI